MFRDITLYRIPDLFIKDFRLHLVPDGGFDKLALRITASAPVDVPADIEIPELGLRETVMLTGGVGEAVLRAAPKLWSPDNPVLYDITARLGSDTVSDRVGFREILQEDET